MMGTSLLAMPWALQQAGLVLGILLMLLMAGIAFYTAYRVVQSPQSLGKPHARSTLDFRSLEGLVQDNIASQHERCPAYERQ